MVYYGYRDMPLIRCVFFRFSQKQGIQIHICYSKQGDVLDVMVAGPICSGGPIC